MYDYLIVGSGLYGSTLAYELTKIGKKVLVIEKSNHVGGNIYTENIEDIEVHMFGAHIFHTNNKLIWEYINQFDEFNNFINSPMAIYNNEIYNLPFNMNTFSKIWNDVFKPEDALKHINEERKEIGNKEPTNLEEQAISLVGRTIYEKLIKGYTEKQWGKDCTELPTFIIKRLPVRLTYNNNYFNSKYQGIPLHGYTNIINKMLKGVEVKLNTDYFSDKDYFNSLANKVIYTGKIDEYYDYCYGKLEYRSLRFEHEILNVKNYQGNAVINYTSKDVPYTRIIEHKHFNNDISDKTIITKEYPVINDDFPCYPINNQANNYLYDKYYKLSQKEEKVIFGGRLGNYKYNDMDKTIEDALNLFYTLEED